MLGDKKLLSNEKLVKGVKTKISPKSALLQRKLSM